MLHAKGQRGDKNKFSLDWRDFFFRREVLIKAFAYFTFAMALLIQNNS